MKIASVTFAVAFQSTKVLIINNDGTYRAATCVQVEFSTASHGFLSTIACFYKAYLGQRPHFKRLHLIARCGSSAHASMIPHTPSRHISLHTSINMCVQIGHGAVHAQRLNAMLIVALKQKEKNAIMRGAELRFF